MFDEETKRKIAETVSKHPHIMRWDGTPVKVRLKVKTDSLHLRQIVIVVRTHVDDAGKKSLQIIRERDESATVAAKGPWNCK